LLPGEDILFSYLNMNTHQAKAESLPDFLGRLGIAPSNIRGNDVWYKSPFRPDERTPSFKIDRTKNVWYDHALGQGGTIIDFVGALHGTTEIPRILAIIADVLGNAPRPMAAAMPPVSQKPKERPIIESVQAISDRSLEVYLQTRGIPIDLARLYLKEVAYRVGENDYRALGFGNDAGGFEVRSAHFKGSLGKKDITSIVQASSQSTAVFEGFFDFLSVLTHYQRDQSNANVLVMNSLAMVERSIEKMQALDTRRIHAYLDHDEAGRRALTTLSAHGVWEVSDASSLYTGYKDANEFLVSLRADKSRSRQLFDQ
jgi:Toprim-like